MVIDHVYADVGDDNVAIKSGADHLAGPQDSPAKNITITDCVFCTHGHGLSIGSELAGGALSTSMPTRIQLQGH